MKKLYEFPIRVLKMKMLFIALVYSAIITKNKRKKEAETMM